MKKITLLALTAFLFLSLTSFGQDDYLGASEPVDFQPDIQIPPPGYSPDVIGCLPCALPEGEPDIQNGEGDVVNGGCNSTPAVFTDINIGDVFCGRTNTYLNPDSFRDTDWYRIVLTQPTTLYFTSIADCPLNIYIVSDDGNCNTATVVVSDVNVPIGTTGQVSYTCAPGTWYLWVGLPVFTGWDAGADYQVVLSDGPPPTPWCAADVPVSNWAIILGVLLIGTFIVVRYRRTLA